MLSFTYIGAATGFLSSAFLFSIVVTGAYVSILLQLVWLELSLSMPACSIVDISCYSSSTCEISWSIPRQDYRLVFGISRMERWSTLGVLENSWNIWSVRFHLSSNSNHSLKFNHPLHFKSFSNVIWHLTWDRPRGSLRSQQSLNQQQYSSESYLWP